MAYNVAGNLRPVRPGAAFLDSRDQVMRNALAERDMAAAERSQAQQQQNALFQQQRVLEQDRVAEQERASASEKDDRVLMYNYLSHLSKVRSNPQVFEATRQRMLQSPLFQKYEIKPEDLTPEELDDALPAFAAEAGIAPAPDPVRFETVDGPRGSRIQRNPITGEEKQVVGPDNSPSTIIAGGFRPLTPQEIQAAGLPAGTSAQVGPDGKIDVLSKRDNTGVLSQKDATTAKMKLSSVALARQQLQAIRDRFNKGREGADFFGPVAGYAATPAGKSFDAAVDQMRSTLTALTRVPGVGAMSDYETRLDQAKFPKRTDWETVTAQKIQGIEDMLDTIESGYTDLLSGGQQQPSQQQEQQGPVRVSTPAEAAALPSGTQFVTPDGQVRVKR